MRAQQLLHCLSTFPVKTRFNSIFQYPFQYCSLDQKRFFKLFKRKKLLSGKFSSHARLANEKHLLWCLFNNTSMLICEAKKGKDLKQALCDDKWKLKIKSTLKKIFFSLCDFFNLYEFYSHYRPRAFKRMYLSSLPNLCAHIYVQQIKRKKLCFRTRTRHVL